MIFRSGLCEVNTSDVGICFLVACLQLFTMNPVHPWRCCLKCLKCLHMQMHTTGSCNSVLVFPTAAERRLELCFETCMGNKRKKTTKDYITQLINKLMRSHFLWKRLSRQKVHPQPFPPTLGKPTHWYYTVEKESSQQEIKLNYHPDRFMWRFTLSLCCFPLWVEVGLSWERTVKYVVK